MPCACMFAQALQCKFLRVGVARACHMLVHSSSVFAAQLQRAPACFRARMEKLGLLDPSLLDTIASLPPCEVIAIFRDVSSGLTMDGYSMHDFFELLSTSHEPASRRRRVLAKLPMEEFSVLGASSTAITEQMEPPPAPEAIPPPRAGKHPGRWPMRMAEGLAEAQGPQAQQEIERKERVRWLDVAVELAKQYDLPVWRLAAGSMDPAGLVRRSAGGRRAKTLRKRTRDFLRLRDWLGASGFFTFPNGDLGVKAVLSYLVARASRNILMASGSWKYSEEPPRLTGSLCHRCCRGSLRTSRLTLLRDVAVITKLLHHCFLRSWSPWKWSSATRVRRSMSVCLVPACSGLGLDALQRHVTHCAGGYALQGRGPGHHSLRQQDDRPGEDGRALVCHHLRLRVHRRRQLA